MTHRIVLDVDGAKLFDTMKGGGDLSEITFRLSTALLAGQMPSAIDALVLAVQGVTVVSIKATPAKDPSPDEGVRAALEEIIAIDQHESRVCVDYDPAGSTYAVTKVDGPCAEVARKTLAALSTPVPVIPMGEGEGLPRGTASAAEVEPVAQIDALFDHFLERYEAHEGCVSANDLADYLRDVRNAVFQALAAQIACSESLKAERDALRISHAAVAEDANEMDAAMSMAWAVLGGAHDLTLAEEIVALMHRNSEKATALQKQGETVRAAFIAGRNSIHGVDPAYHEAAWEAYRARSSAEAGAGAASALPSPLPSQGEPVADLPNVRGVDPQVITLAANLTAEQKRQPEWLWRNHDTGVLSFGRWPKPADLTPYVRADLVLEALAAAKARADSLKAELDEARQAIQEDGETIAECVTRAEAAEARAHRVEEALTPFAGDTMPSLRRTEIAFDSTGLRRSMSPMEIAMLRARTILKETPHGER